MHYRHCSRLGNSGGTTKEVGHMFWKNKSLTWWILVGWWLFPLYFVLVYPVKLIIKLISKSKKSKSFTTLSFPVKTWDNYEENIKRWQSKNAKNNWVNAKYRPKPLYEYEWTDTVVKFIAEPNNNFDEKAIAVYLDNLQIGYVPREINKIYYKEILQAKKAKASVHGGNRRFLDGSGKVVQQNFGPIVDVRFNKE